MRRSRDRGFFSGFFAILACAGGFRGIGLRPVSPRIFFGHLCASDSVAKSHALLTKIVHGFVVFMDSFGFLELVCPSCHLDTKILLTCGDSPVFPGHPVVSCSCLHAKSFVSMLAFIW